MTYLLLKWLHVLGATVLFGTGLGIAFFLQRAHRSRDTSHIAVTAGDVVRADLWFTTTAVILQPLTGVLLMMRAGWSLQHTWIWLSLVLFVLVGVCWLPVVWLQWRMRNLARNAVATGTPLPEQYFRCYRWWFALGWPAFAGVLAILWLMIAKPA